MEEKSEHDLNARHSQTENQFNRKTIAFFSGSPGGSFNYEKWQVWRGISERAALLNLNLIYICGEEFQGFPQAVLYDLVSVHNVDGIIFWNSFTSPRMNTEDLIYSLRRYHQVPVVAIEREIDQGASILVDHRQGIYDLLNHLTAVHGYHRIGFINEKNNLASSMRCLSFEAEAERLGLDNRDLIGTLADLDAAGKRPGQDYHALIVHTDYAAVDVIQALSQRGIRVPDDVAVVGFNDGRDARGSRPPLTTVRIPFRRMGLMAVDQLNRLMTGQSYEPVMKFPMYLILRRSCGCLEPLAEQAVSQPIEKPSDVAVEIKFPEARNEIIRKMTYGMAWNIDMLGWNWAEEMYDAIAAGIGLRGGEEPDANSADVLKGVYKILQRGVEDGINVSRWHDAITVMRRAILPALAGRDLARAEDLFQQLRVLIGQSAMRAEVNRNWTSERRGAILREIEAALLISFDTQQLLDILTDGLGRLGVRFFYLVVYDGPVSPEGYGRLLLAYREGKKEPVLEQDRRFSLRSFLPERYVNTEMPYGMVVEALHLREEQIGYIIFQTEPPKDLAECEIYKALQIQLSSALKGVRLREQLYEALREAEEADQLKSRFLSMVSHELRTPLNLIVGLSEMAMRQQEKGGRQSLDVLRKYHEQIYVNGQHLDRLIRDVLDLASSQVGQMKLTLKPMNLAMELRDAAVMGEQLAEQKKLNFRAEIPDELPLILGDKTRIRQIVLNLLSNAVKFTAQGEVSLTAEIVDGGIRLKVKDTGLGIPREDQSKIFDEFQQTDRSIGRGYGGIGLGLAITRRLVEMHGGKIDVSSAGVDGLGSTFEILLPAYNGEQVEPLKAMARHQDDRVTILASQAGSANELRLYLSRQGFRVEEKVVSNVDFNIDEWLEKPPGAIILDMAPAAELGWEIMKRLKEDPATQDVPVLFYSLVADQTSGSVVEIDYLNKPIGMDELIDALKRHGVKGGRREGVTVLVVDDEPGILDMHTQIVRSYLPDGRVLIARDGVKALDLMRTTRVDLVLLDLLMPELDGFGVIKAMQEEPALRGIPVIVLSGQILTKRDMLRLNQGVAAVLGKGVFSAQEVFQKIEAVLSRSQRVGSEGQRLVFQAMGFIHEHYREQISRADIAGNLNVNEQYLSRCFNKEIGIGPMAYLSRYRIEQAKRMLEEGKYSITQVALEVGLSSQSYFSRIFQQETGVSPSAYQRGRRDKKL